MSPEDEEGDPSVEETDEVEDVVQLESPFEDVAVDAREFLLEPEDEGGFDAPVWPASPSVVWTSSPASRPALGPST